MDLTQGFGARSGVVGPVTGLESLNFSDEFRHLVTTMPPENTGGSFTALLEMPVTQAMELLHFTDSSSSQARTVTRDIAPTTLHPFGALAFPSNSLLLVIATEQNGDISGETANSLPSNSGANLDRVKAEPAETDSVVENQNQNYSSGKRKDREKKVKSSTKKTKSSVESDKLLITIA